MNPDSIKTGGPAFPCDDIVERDRHGSLHGPDISSSGLSVRDYMAAKALQGLLARGIHYQTEGVRMPAKGLEEADIAGHAYAMADAMLAAREAE